MQFKTALCIALQAGAGAASIAASPEPRGEAPCASLHLIVARGSDEPPGEGTFSEIASQATARIPNSDSEGLRYPATFAAYAHSEMAGVRNLTNRIQEYVDRCPKSRIGLIGYSQGAQVIGDTLYGNTEHGKFNHTKPLDLKYGKKISAVVLAGDPTFRPGLEWDAGTSTRHGVFHRHDIGWAYPYAPVTRSYCDHGDVYCATGKSSTAHGLYVEKYAYHAATFIVRSHRRSLRPHGGVDITRSPTYKKNHGTHSKHPKKGHHGHSGTPHRSNNHHHSGRNVDDDNGALNLWQSSSTAAWFLIPLVIALF